MIFCNFAVHIFLFLKSTGSKTSRIFYSDNNLQPVTKYFRQLSKKQFIRTSFYIIDEGWQFMFHKVILIFCNWLQLLVELS